MKSSFYRPRLYRKAVVAVICILIVASTSAQYQKKKPKTSGPRALGVLQLAQNGNAHLVAVAIMIDGRFYDAGAYKADPVPMALQPETVYEAIETGVAKGLFTVSGALHDPKNGWFASGKWHTNEQIEAEKTARKAEQEKLNQKAPEAKQGPPKLKRGIPTDEAPASSADKTPPPSPGKTDSSASAGKKSPADDSAPVRLGPSASMDTDRPVLRRQAPSDTTHEQTKSGTESEPLKGPLQLIPAISDADGPEPRPYKYEMKPEEEQARLKKILAMATDEVKARAEKFSGGDQAKPAKKSAGVQFKDVQMRVFDLSNTNEPVLVVTANATVAGAPGDLTYMTTVVAREDIYGDLHKAFAETTDNQHLDALPRYELIDAVDADGDGRGELLFRLNWDNGSAFSVYRVIGDRLWPLFEGKPGT